MKKPTVWKMQKFLNITDVVNVCFLDLNVYEMFIYAVYVNETIIIIIIIYFLFIYLFIYLFIFCQVLHFVWVYELGFQTDYDLRFMLNSTHHFFLQIVT